MAELPAPPVNVRLVLADGTVIPLELVYVGHDEQGYARWTNHQPIERPDPGPPAPRIKADCVPARTRIGITWRTAA